ncbi:MAG: hypothetical protein IPK62_14495 [Bacteroidetes bacterium]|nr:hypothetical protein [Bacteroidota bacterium]MBP6313907.1 hypothetical protein [Chitinophagaceae bacterium]
MKPIRFALAYLFFFSMLFACQEEHKSTKDADKIAAKESVLITDSIDSELPLLKSRMTLIQAALQKSIPIILLENIDSAQSAAQSIAIHNATFCENIFDKNSKKAFRNEIFNIYPARPQEIPVANKNSKVYKVEMYNYALNESTTALVDLGTQKVISVSTLPQSQPDIPSYLKDLAIQMAINHKEVSKALGYKPTELEALMANTKTALNHTKCERSMHLCVAPTFTQGDKALWVIVDLTDHKIVGIRWTNTGPEQVVKRISEKKLKFDKIMECYCKAITALEKDNWKLNYVITTSDGLRISEVTYKNKLIINSAKVVDWHVSYSNTEGFGYSDAVGCPEFSQAAVVAVSEPRISDIIDQGKKVGFALEQNFSSEQWPLPCNYNYLQRFEFYEDGRFRSAAASLGRGCGNNGTYRPVMRIHFAGNNQQFSQWDGQQWQPWNSEKWTMQELTSSITKEGFLYKLNIGTNTGYFMEPSRGQFGDGGRNDNAYTYVTKLHSQTDEGENDLVTIGPCCNDNFEQGPEKFINNESIKNTDLVIWYVPQMKNDDTKGREFCWAESYLENGVYKTRVFPCMAGAMFVPFQK